MKKIAICTLILLLAGMQTVYAQMAPCDNDVGDACIMEIKNWTGNLSARVCAGDNNTNLNASNFKFWYNNAVVMNVSNLGIVDAYWSNDTAYDLVAGPTFNKTSDPSCIDVIFNNSYVNFTFGMVQLNLSIDNANAYIPNSNSTMITMNYVVIRSTDGGDAALPSAVFMTFNNASKNITCQGPGSTNTNGYWAEHCYGPVIAGNCAGEPPNPNNQCLFDGAPVYYGVQLGADCQINNANSPITLIGFDFISSNASSLTNVTPGTPATLKMNRPVAASFIKAKSLKGNPQEGPPFEDANISSFDVYDAATAVKIASLASAGGEQDRPPIFLDQGAFYNVTLNLTNFGVYNFTIMLPYTGFTGMEILVSNSSQTTAVYGKVVNESDSAVAGAIVYAQIHKNSIGDGIMFIASAKTDANGMFTMTLPKTNWIPDQYGGGQMAWPVYQFIAMSNLTSNGAPYYFQTIDDNDGKGYFAQGSVIYMSKSIKLKSGGLVKANVTLNTATSLISELSKLLILGTGVTKDASTGKFTMLSMFDNAELPTSIFVPFFSPTGNVILNLLGQNQSQGGGPGDQAPITKVCFGTAAVTQAATTPINCSMETAGFLNFSVRTCSNIFNASTCSPSQNMRAGSFNFWFDTYGIIRNSTNDTVLYLSPQGMVLPNLIGFGSGSGNDNLNIPMPPGNYSMELVGSNDWSRYLNVQDRTLKEVLSGDISLLGLDMGEGWRINPMFNPSMILSGNNRIEASVEYMAAGQLNSSRVNLSAKVLYLNKSLAADGILIPYNSTMRKFMNITFNPSLLGLTAGKYYMLMNATSVLGNITYYSTQLMTMNAFDFQLGFDLGGFTFGTNQMVYGKIFAFNSTGPIQENTSAIIVEMYDNTGQPISLAGTYNVTNITNGMASINLTMPSKVGFYNIVVKVNNSNNFGVADNWVQVSNYAIQAQTERNNYKPSDTVLFTIKVTSSSSGAAVANASIEVQVDNGNTPAMNVTGADGKASISLGPATYGTNGNWSFGWHNLKIKISKQTGSDVVNLETWAGFDVRGMEVFLRPQRPSYTPGEEVMFEMVGPSSMTVTTIKVDGTGWSGNPDLNLNANFDQKMFGLSCMGWCNMSNIKLINLTNGSASGWQPGHHNVEVTAGFGGASQSFFGGFDVNTYNIFAVTDAFSYRTNTNITLNVTVIVPGNGSAVAGISVNASLYKAQPPNDIFVRSVSGTTNSNGKVTLSLNATQSGFNYIKINASNQMWFIGVQVSSLTVTLKNATGANVANNEYTVVADGSTPLFVCANATSDNVAIPDGSTMKAYLWSFGNQIDMGSGATTNGFACVNYTFSADSPAHIYGLEVRVTSTTGETASAGQATARVTGGSALQLKVYTERSFNNPYLPGETAKFIAYLTYTNGTPASGRLITFVYGSEGSMPQSAGNATTGSDGMAKLSTTAPTRDGPYYLLGSVSGTDIQSYSGFMVSSIGVKVTPNATEYKPGDNIGLSIYVINRTTGSQIAASSGFVSVFNKDKGKRDITFTPSGSQPYLVNVSVSGDGSAVGSYPIGVIAYVNESQGSGVAMVNVVNGTGYLNVTTPSSIQAGTPFNVTINASSGSLAHVVVFSPAASSLVYENHNLALTASWANVSLNLSYAGMYVIDVFIEGVGSKMKIISASPPSSGTIPQIWTHTSVSTAATTNTTVFSTSNNVYIMSNIENATATVMRLNTTTNTTVSTSLPLKLNSTATYYTIYNSTDLVSSTHYFVRLDTNSSSGVAVTMFKVS